MCKSTDYLLFRSSDVLETRGVAPLLHEIEEAIGNWPMVRRNESKKIAHWSEMLAKYYGRFNLWPVFYLTTESFSMADNITLRVTMIVTKWNLL